MILFAAVVVLIAVFTGLRFAWTSPPRSEPIHDLLVVKVYNDSSSSVGFTILVNDLAGELVLNRSRIVNQGELSREFEFSVPDGFYDLTFLVDETRKATVEIQIGPWEGPVVFRVTDSNLYFLGQSVY